MNAILVGLASVYIWFLVAHASITKWLFKWARFHDGWIGELVGCSFCIGFWVTGMLLLLTGNYDPVTHLAAAAVCGVVGRYAL